MAVAIWNDEVIADSDDVEIVEGNVYFPPESARPECLLPSTHASVCPWKGTAKYFSLQANGRINENAAWSYPEPKSGAQQLKGRIAFWKGVQVVR